MFSIQSVEAGALTDWVKGLFKEKPSIETGVKTGTVIEQNNTQTTDITQGDVLNENTIDNTIENQTTVQGDLVTNEIEAEVTNNVEIGETQVDNVVNVPDQITISPNPLNIKNVDPFPNPLNIKNVDAIPQPFEVLVSEFKDELKIVSDFQEPTLEVLKSLAATLTEILTRLQDFNEGESARIEAAILAGISSESPHFVTEVRKVILEDIEFNTFVSIVNESISFFEGTDGEELKKKSQT